MSEKIKPVHLERAALLYVRQSSSFQVAHNLESQRLQYRMKDRLALLGWESVDVIDEDLGKSASGSVDRSGFQRLVANVCLGKIGVVAARELSRFARNSRDWQQLIEVCRVVDTLLVDEEAIYDARQSNDRLLLGLKGSLNEYELDLLRQRAQKARKQKALRAELGMNTPIGYVNAGGGRLEIDPDQRVQQTIRTVFDKFFELGTARQVMMWFVENGLEFPVRRWDGSRWFTAWRDPTYHSVVRVLKHPIYAGAYAWGKTRTDTVLKNGEFRKENHQRPRDEWLILQQDHHEGYITWDRHERILEMIRKNAQRCARVEPGAAKRGAAMLAGLLRCRRCGRKLTVRYTGAKQGSVLRYVCHSGLHTSGKARCIGFGGVPVDDAVVDNVLKVIEPAAVEAARMAASESANRNDQAIDALKLELEARQFEAERARRQYDAVDPDNRLVAAELERRWNSAIERADEIAVRLQEEYEQAGSKAGPTTETFDSMAENVHAVWDDPEADVRLKKRIIRALVEEVLVDFDRDASEIQLVVHWKGGVHTEVQLPHRRAGQRRHDVPKDVVEAVRVLSRLCSDEKIAGWLTRNGIRTGKGNCWTRQHVTALRHRNDIAVYRRDRQESEGWLNLSQAADYLGISRGTLQAAIRRGEIEAERPLSPGPWVLKRETLDSRPGRQLVKRVERNRERAGTRGREDLTPDLFPNS